MNKSLKIILSITAIILSVAIFYSIKGPLDFNEERDERYVNVIAQLQDISALQKEYVRQTGRFAKGIDTLIAFADTAFYTIRERKDTTIYIRNAQGIKIPHDKVIYRNLAKVSVKDSIFKGRDYSGLAKMRVGDFKNYQSKFRDDWKYNEDSTEIIYTYYFKTFAEKRDILAGLNKNYVINELAEGKAIPDTVISVGSLVNVSAEGNWSPEFDYQANEFNKEMAKKEKK